MQNYFLTRTFFFIIHFLTVLKIILIKRLSEYLIVLKTKFNPYLNFLMYTFMFLRVYYIVYFNILST